jgi:shikimate kinase
MKNSDQRIVLTGFMGVGKSTIARLLSSMLECERIDLDSFIEKSEKRTIAAIIKGEGEARFRRIETESLRRILSRDNAKIVALGGGAWTIEENRRLIKQNELTSVWLESTFEHCWRNISLSKRERPLAKNKSGARALFDDRQKYYCLADWHFVIRPELNSFEIAKKIAEEVFSQKINCNFR